ncbi:triose-phosphate isomerase [Rhizobium rhizosphaerae]|uniref:Triosephosphate isomerase n=1 Tax=Xaviernesmea rhizosphaerae TaxID=1672749 RepID=A0ABX3PDN9_9HYPH|nr:triose-phosphate isomerase [Xaviernesmea rhizosphaerae]OQP86533.1 triose-phosphate isomerase [Xaviernesmea rhizosphaerae]
MGALLQSHTAPRKLIAGNWKMNGVGAALAEIEAMAAAAERLSCDLVLCPAFTLIERAAGLVRDTPVRIGAQDCHAQPAGAFTGDISADMLADAGASHVIIGHSERRMAYAEANEQVAAKALAAYRAGLTAIICVGETEAQRDAGRALDIVVAQLSASLPDGATAANTAIAYEPVWAIGTGRVPAEAQIADMHAAMRQHLSARFGMEGGQMRLLYGGSVKAANAADIFAVPHVDGALVGGASLKAADFLGIAAAA